MCVGGNCGAMLNTSEESGLSLRSSLPPSEVDRLRNFLFAETVGCFIVEVENEKVAEELFNKVPFKILGKTIKEEKLEVKGLFSAEMKKLQEVWQKPMKEIFG